MPRIPAGVFIACYAILGVMMAIAIVTRWFRPVVLQDPVQIDTAQIAEVEQCIDPNTATWSELSRLPGIGENIARRIVEYRDQRKRDADETVFRRVEDLDAVKGIGPVTLERIRPHLRFSKSSSDADKR